MDLELLGNAWNRLGETDPMWAVLMDPERSRNRWDPVEFFETGQIDIADAMEYVRNLGFPLRLGKALDFGCGVGRLSQALACYFDEVHGVDIAPAMVQGARGYNPYGERLQFFVNQRDDLAQFADNQYDFVYSVLVLQHMQPCYAMRYIKEFMRILAPGGLLMFQQPSRTTAKPVPHQYRPFSYRLRSKARRTWKSTREWIEPWLFPQRLTGDDFGEIGVPQYAPLHPRVDRTQSQIRIDPPHGDSQHGTDHNPIADADVPATEIHTISRRKVLSLLKSLGGRVVNVQLRSECSDWHTSYRYLVTKK